MKVKGESMAWLLTLIFTTTALFRTVYSNYAKKECGYKKYGYDEKTTPKACMGKLDMVYTNIEPYSNEMFREILEETIQKCCKNVDSRLDYVYTANISSVIQQSARKDVNYADVIFPVLGFKNSKRMYGHYFVPLISPPGAFFITPKHQVDLTKMIKRCLTLWPLLVLCVAMAAVAGFIAWLCETKNNEDEFPRPFVRGWFEGSWWSFISMTTVGYGDKTPRSIPGRLFSVVWILAGIIVFNTLAGELTSIIIEGKTPSSCSMADQKIGTMNRTYENSLVVRNGGFLTSTPETAANNSTEQEKFFSLVQTLSLSKINGFVLDKYTYRSFKDNVTSNLEGKVDIANFFLHETMMTEVATTGEDDLSYGVLIKDEVRYDYFLPIFENNRLGIQSDMARHTRGSYSSESNRLTIIESDLERRISSSYSSKPDHKTENIYEKIGIAYILIPIGVIVFFGAVFETWRRAIRYKFKTTRTADSGV